jgi:hypothetical protein
VHVDCAVCVLVVADDDGIAGPVVPPNVNDEPRRCGAYVKCYGWVREGVVDCKVPVFIRVLPAIVVEPGGGKRERESAGDFRDCIKEDVPLPTIVVARLAVWYPCV